MIVEDLISSLHKLPPKMKIAVRGNDCFRGLADRGQDIVSIIILSSPNKPDSAVLEFEEV